MFEYIPEELKALPQWVCAWENSKLPMKAFERKAASSINPETWSDFKTAEKMVLNKEYDYLGFVFNNNGIVGIDIDCGFDDNGFLSDISLDCMKACESFTEKSRSGRGIHIYVKGNLPFDGKNNRHGIEIYKTGRYFITTGKRLVYGELRANQSGIDYIVNKYFAETERESESTGKGTAFYTPLYNTPEQGKIKLTPYYPPINSGLRNDSLTSYAGQLHSQGYDKGEIYKELLRCNTVACKPPLPAREIQSIVNSVTRYKR